MIRTARKWKLVHAPRVRIFRVLLALCLWSPPHPAHAAGLDLELANTEDGPQGCVATVLINNHLDRTLDRFRLDLLLFDGAGKQFDRLIIDLAPLPHDRITAAAIPLHGGACADISRVLVYGVPACRSQGQNGGQGKSRPAMDCLSTLAATTRTAIGFGK